MLYFPILYVLLFNILYICVTYIALNDLIVKYFFTSKLLFWQILIKGNYQLSYIY